MINYITEEVAGLTDKKSIKNAYERENVSIIENAGVWYTEFPFGMIDTRLLKTIKKEMKRLYPKLVYLYDIPTPFNGR